MSSNRNQFFVLEDGTVFRLPRDLIQSLPMNHPESSKSPSSKSNPPMAATGFQKFMDLPYELRDMIWEMAAVDIAPRTIELRIIPLAPKEDIGRLEYFSQMIDPVGNDLLPPKPRHTHTFGSPAPPPALLSVSQHARKVVKRHYEFAFRPINEELLDVTREPYRTALNGLDLKCPNCTCCIYGIWCNFKKDIFVAGKRVFLNDNPQGEWMDDFEDELYGRKVFQGSRKSIHKIQILALPIRSLWSRNTMTWRLGFLPGVKQILLVRTRGFDKKAYMKLKGREIEADPACPEGKDEAVFVARTRGFRVMNHYMMAIEAKAMAGMMFVLQRITVQKPEWKGPDDLEIWTATVKKRTGESKFKIGARKVWETVSGKRLRNWMDKNYISPNLA